MINNDNNFWADIVSTVALLTGFIFAIVCKLPWVSNTPAVLAIMVVGTFCILAGDGLIDAKDFMLIVSITINFFFTADFYSRKNKNDKGDN